MNTVDVVIIGGGASGYFCACELLLNDPNLKVEIWEKSNKTLGKVRVSGGGRCNVTHDIRESRTLLKKYPRGGKYLKEKLNQFGVDDTEKWFLAQGIPLKTEGDNRMFPITNSSETIAACFENTFKKLGGTLRIKTSIETAEFDQNQWKLQTTDQDWVQARFLVMAIGGLNENKSQWLQKITPTAVTPLVPSIFTLNIDDPVLHSLAGVAVAKGRIKYEGIKSDYEGPVLITHWGLSGPAVLTSSAWHAVDLFERNYEINVQVGWIVDKNEDAVRAQLQEYLELHKNKNIRNAVAFGLPKRLWDWILDRSEISPEKECIALRKEERNRLIENLMRSKFEVSGRTTYKEEFVTAGGIKLDELDSDGAFKGNSQLFAIGEMLDLDGVTGGFNFQAAWSTAFVCAKKIRSMG